MRSATRLHSMATVAAWTWAAVSVSAQPAASDSSELEHALQKASAYAVRFRGEFAKVIGVEHYQQTVRRSAVHQGLRSRRIESEVFFTSVGEPPMFMTVRSTVRVDGRAVPGAHQRVVDALSSDSPASRQNRLRALAVEGARYNLGAVGRTFNDPTLALMFLSPELRQRFVFSIGEPRAVAGEQVQRLEFLETTRPSLIVDDRDNMDADIRGSMEVTNDGRVLSTDLEVAIATRVVAGVRVRYGYESKLKMLVPVSMNEDYRNDDGANLGITLITCTARYSGYRRFDTSVRILPP